MLNNKIKKHTSKKYRLEKIIDSNNLNSTFNANDVIPYLELQSVSYGEEYSSSCNHTPFQRRIIRGGKVITAFPGLGKSTLAQNNINSVNSDKQFNAIVDYDYGWVSELADKSKINMFKKNYKHLVKFYNLSALTMSVDGRNIKEYGKDFWFLKPSLVLCNVPEGHWPVTIVPSPYMRKTYVNRVKLRDPNSNFWEILDFNYRRWVDSWINSVFLSDPIPSINNDELKDLVIVSSEFGLSDLLLNDHSYKSYNDYFVVYYKRRNKDRNIRKVFITFINGMHKPDSLSDYVPDIGVNEWHVLNASYLADRIRELATKYKVDFYGWRRRKVN